VIDVSVKGSKLLSSSAVTKGKHGEMVVNGSKIIIAMED